MTPRKKVLIICTGNSCRSIMAEAIVNHFLGDKWLAFSAGIAPSEVNPRARQVLAEIGIDITGYYSKSVEEFINRDDLDLIITVCDKARQTCPAFVNPVKQIHIGIEDPASFTDLPDEIALPKFSQILDEIKIRITTVLKEYY
jgi:arsenate reductase